MTSEIDYKAHHFFPELKELEFKVKKPVARPVNVTPEYRIDVIPAGANAFIFPSSHYPGRIQDIFIENLSTSFLMSNRPIYTSLGMRMYSNYNYSYPTRLVYFNQPLDVPHKIHWLDFSKLRMYMQHWITLEINSFPEYKSKTLLQGAFSPMRGVASPQSVLEQPGNFQGSYRCYLAIDTLPQHGMVCLDNEMKNFMYRTSTDVASPYDTFQYRIYNHLGQESDPYCAKIQLL